MSTTTFGPGTVTFKFSGVPEDFSCEVNSGTILHAYETVDQKTRMCDTVKRAPKKVRAGDGLKLSLSNDLGAEGFYAQLHDYDLQTVDVEFVPNTVTGASWAGQIQVVLPSEIGGGEWGGDIESEVEFQSPGVFVFTPGGVV